MAGFPLVKPRFSAQHVSGEDERVYYVMALRHLLPLALGYHYLRPPGAGLMGVEMRADEFAGLECWLVQRRRDPEAPSGVQDALSQVAEEFVEHRGAFESAAKASESLPADLFWFLDHRIHEDEDEELEAIGGDVLEGPDLLTVVVVGGAYSQATAGSHWRRSFRNVVEWVDSLRVVGAGPLPPITDVESIHPIYLRVFEDSAGGRDVRNVVVHERGVLETHRRIERRVTDRAAYVFMQRLLGNPSVLTLVWTTRAYTARALGDHSQAVLYAAIAAEQMIRHIASMLQWEEDRRADTSTPVSLSDLFDHHPRKLLKQIGEKLGFESDSKREGCPDEIRTWHNDIARIRNAIMHIGHYPSGNEADRSTDALGNLGEYLSDRLTANAERFPITALVLCGLDRLPDGNATEFVRPYARNHDDYVREYRDALTQPTDAEQDRDRRETNSPCGTRGRP